MSPRPLQFGILLVLTLFCVSELGRFRPLLAKASGDVATTKQLKEGGGEEKYPQSVALVSSATLVLTHEAGYAEALEMASRVAHLLLVDHHLRGPPKLATI